jgi:hypothetical protein
MVMWILLTIGQKSRSRRRHRTTVHELYGFYMTCASVGQPGGGSYLKQRAQNSGYLLGARRVGANLHLTANNIWSHSFVHEASLQPGQASETPLKALMRDRRYELNIPACRIIIAARTQIPSEDKSRPRRELCRIESPSTAMDISSMNVWCIPSCLNPNTFEIGQTDLESYLLLPSLIVPALMVEYQRLIFSFLATSKQHY